MSLSCHAQEPGCKNHGWYEEITFPFVKESVGKIVRLSGHFSLYKTMALTTGLPYNQF